MAAAHQSYTKRLEAQCLLAKNLSPIRSAVIQLLDLAVAFYDAHALLQKASTSEDDAAAAREKKKKKRRRRSALQVTAARDASDSDGDADAEERDSDERGDYDADTEKKAILEGPFPERVRKAWREFEKLNNFIIAGLRQIGRSGGEACWEMLAERLE